MHLVVHEWLLGSMHSPSTAAPVTPIQASLELCELGQLSCGATNHGGGRHGPFMGMLCLVSFSPIHVRFERIACLDIAERSSFLALSKQRLCILLHILEHAHIDHVPSASVSVAIAVQSTPLSLNPPSRYTVVQHTSFELDLRYILQPSNTASPLWAN